MKTSGNSVERLMVTDIKLSGGFQMRVALDQTTIDEYSQRIEENPDEDWVFDDPCTVFKIDGDLYLIDGFHRFAAMQKCEKTHVMATVHTGTRLDALKHALGANARHGLKRSNEDKRRAVRVALEQPEFANLSNRQIGELCSVSDHFVGDVRVSLRTDRTETLVGIDGRKQPASRKSQEEQADKIQQAIENSPGSSDREIAKLVGCGNATVGRIRKKLAASREQSRGSLASVQTPESGEAQEADDLVSRVMPEHLSHFKSHKWLATEVGKTFASEIDVLLKLHGRSADSERTEIAAMFSEMVRASLAKYDIHFGTANGDGTAADRSQ
jgi:hypothetical protein